MSAKLLPQILKKILLENNLLTQEDLEEASQISQTDQLPLEQVLIEKGYFTPQEFSLVEKMASVQKKKFLLANKYELLGKIGQGGMGHVFKARDIDTEELVAIKVLDEQLSEDPDFVARFQREVEFSYKLKHPNIVTAMDTGKDGKAYYLVMELVDGIPLSVILTQEGSLEESEAVDIADQLARALEYIHAQGFIHRDIKPDNILVLPDGAIKLIDMGLVRSTENASLTLTGSVLGTPHYLSPEQARGEKDLDIRSDIYSLGATFYQMLTGRTPFVGQNPLEVINQHIHGKLESPLKFNPHLSKKVVSLVLWMMKKDREKRPAEPMQVHDEIEKIRAKSKSFIFKGQSTRHYKPTMYYMASGAYVRPAEYIFGKEKALSFLLLLALFSAGGTALWGFYLRKNFISTSPEKKESHPDEKALQKARAKLRAQKTEEAFILYRNLFENYGRTPFITKKEKEIGRDTSLLSRRIANHLNEVELSNILKFGGELRKGHGGTGYRLVYQPSKKGFWDDWTEQKISHSTSSAPFSSLTGSLLLLKWNLKFSAFRKITLEIIPQKNSILGLSLGNIHLLIQRARGKIYLWQGRFDLPKSKFETVGMTSPKIYQQDCSINPNLEEVLTLQITEKDDKTLFLPGSLQNSFCKIQGEIKKSTRGTPSIPLFIRSSPDVQIRKIEVEGRFHSPWMERRLKKIMAGWKKKSPR